MFDLCLVTDPGAAEGMIASVRAALRNLPPGRVALQLRAKRLGARALLEVAQELRSITRDAGVALLVNERCDVARLVGADGVQLPEASLPPSAARTFLGPGPLIGVSCHDAAGLSRARAEAADFAVLAPVFEVPEKPAALGLEVFRELTRAAHLPVFALGGICAANVAAVCGVGAHGVAVIRAVFGPHVPHAPDDPRSASDRVRELLTALDAARAAREG
jgi:thiamine-phosphate pyrophosphorylase